MAGSVSFKGKRGFHDKLHIVGCGGDFNGGTLTWMIFAQILFGAVIGVLVAFASSYVLARVQFGEDGFDTIFVFSMALVSYAGAFAAGGNGYLAVYITGIILGNRPLKNKKSLVHFFDGITGLMQMLLFFLLGLLAFPSQLPRILPYALAIALFLTLVSRPMAVFAILTPFRCSIRQQLVVSWAGLRGAASIVFAIMAVVSPAYMKHDVFHIVIFIVLFSISIQGSLISVFAKKMDMIDAQGNVMKTFSDYSEEMPVEFVKISVTGNHPWVNKKIKEIESLPDLLLVLILRGDKRLVPNGNTRVHAGDKIVLSALSPEENLGIHLNEIKVEADSKWIGKPLSKIKLGEGKLALILKREEKVMIPNGETVILENDTLVVSQV